MQQLTLLQPLLALVPQLQPHGVLAVSLKVPPLGCSQGCGQHWGIGHGPGVAAWHVLDVRHADDATLQDLVKTQGGRGTYGQAGAARGAV